MTTRGKKNERGATAVEYGLLVAVFLTLAIFMPVMYGHAKAAFHESSCNRPGYSCTP